MWAWSMPNRANLKSRGSHMNDHLALFSMLPTDIRPLSIAQERKVKQTLWLKRLKVLEEKELWLKEHPLIPEYRPRLSEPGPFWLVFFRQKQAFECSTAHPEDVHTFAFEPENRNSSSGKGLRKYVVTSYAQIWHTVKSLAHKERHGPFYEVIPEGAACKLYFDLEFRRDLNPDADGAAMVQTLIKFVCFELQKMYDIHCSERHVINLDASTGSKFSRHLIFNLPGAIFQDNHHAGNFVQWVCRRIEAYCRPNEQSTGSGSSCGKKEPDAGDPGNHGSEEFTGIDSPEPPAKKSRNEASDGDACSHGNKSSHPNHEDGKEEEEFKDKDKLKDFYVNVPDGEKEFFIDTAVYTRNRNFRLYKCVKLAKSNPLLVAADNKYEVKMPSKKKPARPGGEEYQFFLDSLITHVKFTPYTKVLTCKGDREESSTKFRRAIRLQDQDGHSSQSDRAETIEGYQSSPFPAIDSYIRRFCISKGGVVGEIRRWTYFSEAQLLVYDIIKNRWCENIERQHKSNNIMILVDLRRGVYYQKCHDPTCRAQNFKSDEYPVPPEHLPSFTDWDEEELINVSLRAEEDARMNQSATSSDIDSFLVDDGADEELIRLGESFDASETGTEGESSHRVLCSENGLSGARNGRHSEGSKSMSLANGFDGSATPAQDLERGDGGVAGKRTTGEVQEEWDDQITDDELMRSFQES